MSSDALSPVLFSPSVPAHDVALKSGDFEGGRGSNLHISQT